MSMLSPTYSTITKRFLPALTFMLTLALSLVFTTNAWASNDEANLDIDSASITVIKKSLVGRFAKLKPLLDAGTIGLTRDGQVGISNRANIHPTELQQIENLVTDENKDRLTLYREIARANSRPDWEEELKRTFGERWINRAPMGWMVQDIKGGWVKK